MVASPLIARWTRAELALVGVATAIGLAERIAWNLLRKPSGATGEAANVAAALARTGQFADAFQPGQGPTAHFTPTTPAIGGMVYRLAGVHTPLAESLLSAWALALVFGCYALFGIIAARLGVPRRNRIGGYCFLAAIPVYIGMEAVDFRLWEGGLTLLLAAMLLWLVLRETGEAVAGGRIVLPAILAALLFFVSPPMGLAGYLTLLLFAWRRLHWRQTSAAAVITLAALTLMIVPWASRNARLLGEPILLRDNAGLELALADHPAAVAASDPKAVFDARLAEIHPYVSTAAFERMRAAGGEPAYARQLGRATRRWIVSAPGDFALLLATHLREFLFPRAWMFQTAHGVWLPWARALAASLVSLLGLIGLWRRRHVPGVAYLAPLLLVPPLIYMPFQPIARYCWLIYPPLAYLAADVVGRIKSPTLSPRPPHPIWPGR